MKKFYDIRIAMAAPEGLLVQVVMRIRKIFFTNGGVFSSLISTRILKSLQGGILGMIKIKDVYCPFLRSLDWDGKRSR
ncbi:hypothetical protein HFZ78_05090 [Priestia megaterium]|uniref:Uncharacterized protein n=1 Tax=Priestia megaterium TaxID=1404 RepID=A0A6H1NY42_PRIMG|nr:hypothetical protein HFZ78_05090 [Priestia megaterium]